MAVNFIGVFFLKRTNNATHSQMAEVNYIGENIWHLVYFAAHSIRFLLFRVPAINAIIIRLFGNITVNFTYFSVYYELLFGMANSVIRKHFTVWPFGHLFRSSFFFVQLEPETEQRKKYNLILPT